MAFLQRRISFPVEAVFQSAVQESDNVELLRLLRISRSQLNLDETNHSGLTALHVSVLNKNLDGVKLLLSNGADPDVPDDNGFTPLHTASATGLLQIAALLLIHQANAFLQTNDGDLPVDVAHDADMIQLLTNYMITHVHRETYLQSWLVYHLQFLIRILTHCLYFILHVAIKAYLFLQDVYLTRKQKVQENGSVDKDK